MTIHHRWRPVRELTCHQPAHHACVRTAVALQLFEKMAENGDQPTSVNYLAGKTNADAALLGQSH